MSDQRNHVIWYPGHERLVPDIIKAENCHLYDADGKKYVDLESGVWCTSIGHGHPRILHVLTEQSCRIMHSGFNYSSRVVQDAAREILARLHFDQGHCAFLCSGSEAVEYGVRTAKTILDRPLLLTMADSYFGAYGSASRRQEDEWFGFDWTACAECPEGETCGGTCVHWASIPFDRIGGFLFEPGSSSGLVQFPPEKLIRNIAAVVKQRDGIVLINEVTTGIGRTGALFGFQHYGLEPDVVALGKGIGNGYPVSVAAFGAGVIERLGDKPLMYAQSHQNDPLGAAVAREVLKVIEEEDLIGRGREISARLHSGLEGIKGRTECIREIRLRGLMAAVEFRDSPDTPFTIHVHRELVRLGYVTGRRSGFPVLRLDPALTIELKDLEGFLETLEAVLS